VFIEGDAGSLELHWRDGATNPFQPLEWMEVRTAAGRRRIDVPSLALPEIHVEGMRGLIADFVDAIETGRRPMAAGEDGLHVLELTLGAYESAALGRTIEVPLDRGDPVFLGGVAAIPGLDGPAWSPVLRQRLYTTQPQS
jgi:predicted dehydrogenase